MNDDTITVKKHGLSQFKTSGSYSTWFKTIALLLILIVIGFWIFQSQYFKVNRYESTGAFVVKAEDLYRKDNFIVDLNEYVFSAKLTQQDEKYISFEIHAQCKDKVEQIKVYKTLAKLIYKDDYATSNSASDGYLNAKESANINSKSTIFNPIEVYFDSPKELKLGIKLKKNEPIDIQDIELVVPLDVRVFLTRQDGSQIFDAYGHAEYTSRMTDVRFTFKSKPIHARD